MASELFVVGYPFGMVVSGILPIWKRATIASEPNATIDGLEYYYVDTLSHPGMSGSPVFAIESRSMMDVSKTSFDENGRLDIQKVDFTNVKSHREKFFMLAGIYSGRYLQMEKDPSLGIVWKKSLIDELIEERIPLFSSAPPTRD